MKTTAKQKLRTVFQRAYRRFEHEVALAIPPPPTPSREERLAEVLGLVANPAHAAQRQHLRQMMLNDLSGCSPGGAKPEEMAGYVGESALRIRDTVDLVARHVTPKSLLEIGSNPYFMSIAFAQHFPGATLSGVNFFGQAFPRASQQSQPVTDPRRRMTSSAFLHANVESDSLESTGLHEVATFCEVIEHLPYDPCFALFNIARQIEMNGFIVLTTPNPARRANIWALALEGGSIDDPISSHGIHGRHNREYTASELVELITRTGFEVLECYTRDVFPDVWSYSAEQLGFGEYHYLIARKTRQSVIYRPEWLYRGFAAHRLSAAQSMSD